MARLYVPLDVNFPDDPKIERAGLEGSGLFAQAMCVAKRTTTDGIVTRTKLRRLGGSDELIDRLIDVGLFAAAPDDSVHIVAWLSWNIPAESVLTSEKAKRLAHQRHHVNTGKSSPACRYCTDTNPQVDAEKCVDDADRMNTQCVDAMQKREGEVEPFSSSLRTSSVGPFDDDETTQPDQVAQTAVETPGPVDLEQESRKAINLYAKARAAGRNPADRAAYEAGIRKGAKDDGTEATLRSLVAGGMTAQEAADTAAAASVDTTDPFGPARGPARREPTADEQAAIREKAQARIDATVNYKPAGMPSTAPDDPLAVIRKVREENNLRTKEAV